MSSVHPPPNSHYFSAYQLLYDVTTIDAHFPACSLQACSLSLHSSSVEKIDLHEHVSMRDGWKEWMGTGSGVCCMNHRVYLDRQSAEKPKSAEEQNMRA